MHNREIQMDHQQKQVTMRPKSTKTGDALSYKIRVFQPYN